MDTRLPPGLGKRLALLPLALLAAPSLSGCVAVAIPALAGSAMVGSRVVDNDSETAPAPVVSAAPAPVVPAPIAPTPAAPTPVRIAAIPPTPAPAPAPIAATPVAVAAAVPIASPPPVVPAARDYPDPANPLPPEQFSFARFVRFSQASALGAKRGEDQLSAMLTDPVALDGQRRRCAAGEQQIALIDLDPADGIFSPPANPARQTGLALGLAVLREVGVEIAWMSDMPVEQSGLLRTALEQAGLDPRGEDIISLRRDESDNKHLRKQNLAGIACIIAIAGDERPDFDERFKYLRNPEAGAGLEPLIGDGWFLIPPLVGQ